MSTPVWGQNVKPSELRNNKEIQIPPQDVTIRQADRPQSWDEVQPFTPEEVQAFLEEGASLLASGQPLDIPAFGVPTLTYLRLVRTIQSRS